MPNKIVLVHSAKGPDIYHYGVKGQKWGVITKKEDEPTSGRIKNTYGYTEGTYRRDQDEGGIGGGSQTPGVNGSGYYHPSASNTEKKANVEKVQENYTEAVMGLGLGAAKAVLEGKMSYKDASDRIWQTMLDLDNRRKNEPGFEYQLQLGDGTQLFANSQTNNMSQFFQDAMYILRIVCDEADKGPAYKKAYLDAINNGDFFKSAPSSSGKFNKDAIKFALSDIKRQVNSMPKAQSKLATASKKSLNDSKKKTMLSTVNQNNKNSSKNKSKVSSTKVESATINKPKHMGSIASTSKKSTKTDKTPKFNGSGLKTYYHNDKKRYSHNLKQSDNNGLILVHSANGPDVQHWGILGMKWGVRRYQNPDGTLTEEGKMRYRNSSPEERVDAISKVAKKYARYKLRDDIKQPYRNSKMADKASVAGGAWTGLIGSRVAVTGMNIAATKAAIKAGVAAKVGMSLAPSLGITAAGLAGGAAIGYGLRQLSKKLTDKRAEDLKKIEKFIDEVSVEDLDFDVKDWANRQYDQRYNDLAALRNQEATGVVKIKTKDPFGKSDGTKEKVDEYENRQFQGQNKTKGEEPAYKSMKEFAEKDPIGYEKLFGNPKTNTKSSYNSKSSSYTQLQNRHDELEQKIKAEKDPLQKRLLQQELTSITLKLNDELERTNKQKYD